MFMKLIALLKNKSGVTAIEYGLIAALVGVAIIGGATALGGGLDTLFTDINTTGSREPIGSPPPPPPTALTIDPENGP